MAKQPIHRIRFGYIKANIWFHQQNPATPQRDGHPLSKRRERSHTSVPTGTIGSTPAQNFGSEELERLELRVAQRADELARTSRTRGGVQRDRETWLRAESELLQNFAPIRSTAHRRETTAGA